MKKACFFLLIFSCLLPYRVRAAVEDHIVTGVKVQCIHEDVHYFRNYTDSRKVEAVLNYLRLCRFAGLPEDTPPAQPDSRSVFTVFLAGGNQRIYQFLDGQYLSKDGGPWELVELPEETYLLLQAIPGDR